MSRYVKYFQSLLASDCAELAVVANIAGRDRSSTTGINLYKLGGDGVEPVGGYTGAGEGGPSGEGAGSAGSGSVASFDTGEKARD